MERDGQDHLLVPAGPIRIVIGCLMIAGGVFLAALTTHNWVRVIGFLMFVVAPFVMLKRPVKDTQAFEERNWRDIQDYHLRKTHLNEVSRNGQAAP